MCVCCMHLIYIYYNAPILCLASYLFVGLFVCPLWKSAPLRGSTRNAPCRLRDSGDMFLGHRRSSNCSVAEDREEFFFHGPRRHFIRRRIQSPLRIPDRATLAAHFQCFLVPNFPTVVRPLTKKYLACGHCPCSPVKDIHQHHDTLIYINVYMYCVIACPLLHAPACKHSACLGSMLLY